MVRSLETGRGVDWLGVGMGMLYHLTRPLQARTGGAGRQECQPGRTERETFPDRDLGTCWQWKALPYPWEMSVCEEKD